METLLDIKDVLHMRINHQTNNIFFSKINEKNTTYPRRTLFSDACMICGSREYHSISYLFDQYPMRHIFFCHKSNCFLKALSTYVKDANTQNLYPFLKIKQPQKIF